MGLELDLIRSWMRIGGFQEFQVDQSTGRDMASYKGRIPDQRIDLLREVSAVGCPDNAEIVVASAEFLLR
jgi:hypothetical protein